MFAKQRQSYKDRAHKHNHWQTALESKNIRIYCVLHCNLTTLPFATCDYALAWLSKQFKCPLCQSTWHKFMLTSSTTTSCRHWLNSSSQPPKPRVDLQCGGSDRFSLWTNEWVVCSPCIITVEQCSSNSFPCVPMQIGPGQNRAGHAA